MLSGTLGTGFGIYIPLVIYFALIVTCFISMFWKPQLGMYMLILIIPLETTREKLAYFPVGAQVIYFLWFSVLLGAFFHRTGEEGPLIPRSRVNLVLFLLAALTYLSLWQGWFFLGGSPPIDLTDQRFSDWRSYVLMPAIALLAAAVLRDRKQLKYALLLMFFVSFLVNWSFFRAEAGRDFSHYSEAVRDAGVLGYAGANGFSAFVAEIVVLGVCLFFFIREKRIRIALAALTSFGVYCLLFSFSRGGYAACVAGLAFLAFYRQRTLLIGLVALVLAWQVVLPKAVLERINMTYDQNDQTLDESAEERVDLWQDAATLISASPIIGAGFDTYQFMHRVGPYRDTHNYYVKVLVEMGAVGFLLLLAVLWKMWRAGMALYRSTEDPFLGGLGFGLAAMIVTAAVANVFGDRWTYLQVDGLMWVLLGCVIRGQLIVDQEAEALEPSESSPLADARDGLVAVS